MKEMTTAEFAKANLAALAEPVQIRRYTTTVGTYYPQGFEPSVAPVAPPPTLGLTVAHDPDPEVVAKIVDLELEVKRLKQELAKRPAALEVPEAFAPKPVAVSTITQPKKSSEDPFAGLAKQDRDFFERKLGTGSKKK
jgi:hypothetical protein